jgi:hypothetical protein
MGRNSTGITAGGGKSFRSSSASSSSSGRGQLKPAAAARRRYSPMVARPMEQLRAMARLFSLCSHFNRRTSLIVRIDNLSIAACASSYRVFKAQGIRGYPASMPSFSWGGRMAVEWVAASPWNDRPDGPGIHRFWCFSSEYTSSNRNQQSFTTNILEKN